MPYLATLSGKKFSQNDLFKMGALVITWCRSRDLSLNVKVQDLTDFK